MTFNNSLFYHFSPLGSIASSINISRQSTQDYSDGPIRDFNDQESVRGYVENTRHYDERDYADDVGEEYGDDYIESEYREYGDGDYGSQIDLYERRDSYDYDDEDRRMYDDDGVKYGEFDDYDDQGTLYDERGVYAESARCDPVDFDRSIRDYGDGIRGYTDGVLDMYECHHQFDVPSPARIRWIEAFNKVRAQLSEVSKSSD